MSNSTSASDTSRTIRMMQATMHVLFTVLLLIGFIRALASGSRTGLHLVLVLGAVVVFVAVYLSGLQLEQRAQHAHRQARSQRSAQAWITLVVAGWLVLLWIAKDFAWMAFALYFLVLHIALRPLAIVLITTVLTGSVVALNADATTRNPGTIAGPLIGMLVALGIAWIYSQLRRENEARQKLVDELLAAQDDVLATQEELALTQHETGVLAERARLARDIHDTLAQSFSSIILLSRAGLTHHPDDGLLQQIEHTASDGLTQAREVVHALTPAELREAPLFAALQRLGTRLHEQAHITVRTELEGEVRPLPVNIDVALLRIAQGALANVRLHSQASRVGITLTYDTEGVGLEIIDDGIGFTDEDVAAAPLSGSGFGLRAIRERVMALSGTLTVESTPHEGSALLVRIPTHESPS